MKDFLLHSSPLFEIYAPLFLIVLIKNIIKGGEIFPSFRQQTKCFIASLVILLSLYVFAVKLFNYTQENPSETVEQKQELDADKIITYMHTANIQGESPVSWKAPTI